MERNRCAVFFGWIFPVLTRAIIPFGIHTSYAFTLGETYDSSNWRELENSAPPFLVNWVKRGDFILKTGGLNFDPGLEKDFLLAGVKNLGKFDINEEGFIVEKETGKRPKLVYGLPFPKISVQDPKAGEYIMANHPYVRMRLGAYVDPGSLTLIGKGGKEREISGVAKFFFYQGRPGAPSQNPDNLLFQFLVWVVSPMDIKGTVLLFWEYDDKRPGTCFTYASMMRRITRAASNTRSNPFLGSDMSPDDVELWYGKNNDFNWKLIGEKEVLCGFSSPDKITAEDLPDGSVKLAPFRVKLGFEIPDRKGAAWAPVNVTWSPRPVWIVEGVPKNSDYGSGRLLFYVDKETFGIWFKEVYDRSGQYWKGMFAVKGFHVTPSGRNNLYSNFYGAVDEREQHASYVQLVESAGGVNYLSCCLKSVIGPNDFTVVAAQKLTK